MTETLYLDYACDRDFLIVKIFVCDRKGLPYETTRTMIPWEVLSKGMARVRAKARKLKKKSVQRIAKKTVPKKKPATKRGRK